MKTLYTNPSACGIYARNAFVVEGDIVTIQVSQGMAALFDLADLPLLAAHRWYADEHHRTYYARTNITLAGGKRMGKFMHRILCETTPNQPTCDHLNGDGLDNRRENLRPASHSENQRNRGMPSNNTAGFKGVSTVKKTGKCVARIKLDGKSLYLGTFADALDAALAYDAAAIDLHGEFAVLNFPARAVVAQ